jgi:two-component system NtrC family sensor kinase
MAGLAHEIRNPLNAIRLNLFTVDRVFRGDAALDSDEVAVMLGESAREIERVDELIHVLLGYARPERAKIEFVDLPREIDAVLRFLRPSFLSGEIDVEVAIPAGPIYVAAGRGDVRQILLNLLGNARDAVGERPGKIGVALRERSGTIELLVQDNGPGVAPDDRDKIFQPFFTTKENGAGLGLAVVRSLVEAAGGGISFENVAEGGCCFVVRWPIAKKLSHLEEMSVV